MKNCLTQFLQSLLSRNGAWENRFDIWKCQESFIVDLEIDINILLNKYSKSDVIYPLIRIYKDGMQVEKENYTYTWRYGGEEFQDVIDIDKVKLMMESGCTIIFQSLEQYFPVINMICRNLENILFCSIHANAFYTSPNSVGVAPHYDRSDVITIQINGSKSWNVWGFKEYLATGKSRYHQNDIEQYISKSATKNSFILSKGDALYLPRGIVHQAIAEQQESLHISFVVQNIRWSTILLDVVNDICSELSEQEEFRATWYSPNTIYPTHKPVGSTTDKDIFVKEILKRISEDRVKNLVNEKVTTGSFPSNRGRLLDIINSKNIDKNTFIVLRLDKPYSIKLEHDSVKLSTNDKIISFPKNAYAALIGLKITNRTKVGKLNGLISLDSKVLIAQKLVKSGICFIEKNEVQ